MTTNEMPIHRIDQVCKGPNHHCRAAFKAGRPVHVIPGSVFDLDPAMRPPDGLTLVLGTYHYATEAEAREAVADAYTNAPLVTCDDDLYAFRARNISYKLPVGWVDPSRRRVVR
jgi:hypothetical protein